MTTTNERPVAKAPFYDEVLAGVVPGPSTADDVPVTRTQAEAVDEVGPQLPLKPVFEQFDVSGDGYLQLDELKRAFRAIGLQKRSGEKFEMDAKTFAAFDTNGDGKVSFEEFEQNLHPKARAKIEEKLVAGWKFDAKLWAESCERHSKINVRIH